MSKVRITRGTEGPRHDPYGYENITVIRPNGNQVTFHIGLAIWCNAEYANGTICHEEDPGQASDLFAKVAGCNVQTAERAFRRLQERPYRFHNCHPRYLKGIEGLPGEHFIICRKCGDTLEVQFSISEVA